LLPIYSVCRRNAKAFTRPPQRFQAHRSFGLWPKCRRKACDAAALQRLAWHALARSSLRLDCRLLTSDRAADHLHILLERRRSDRLRCRSTPSRAPQVGGFAGTGQTSPLAAVSCGDRPIWLRQPAAIIKQDVEQPRQRFLLALDGSEVSAR
jgi:hypothetical protein